MTFSWISIAMSFSLLQVQPQPTSAALEAKRILDSGAGALQEFASSLDKAGIHLDTSKKTLTLEGAVQNPNMPIEYLIVGSKGATHETLFVTSAKPSLVTTALHVLGLQPGANVQYKDKNPLPKDEEIAEGVLPYEVVPPQGDGVFIYVQWKAGDETRRYRIEDLILNTKRGKTAARVKWIFLGSRMLAGPKKDSPAVFAADLEENFVSLCYFSAGNQVLTNPDLDAQEQHLYFPNPWLLPEKGSNVSLIFSKEKLENWESEGR